MGKVWFGSEDDRRKLQDLWNWMQRLTGSGVTNTPFGAVINTSPQAESSPFIPPKEIKTLRIAGTSTGGVNFGTGKYDAYVQIFSGIFVPSNTLIGATNSVCLGEAGMGREDGEQVILWNEWENSTLADTSRSHLLASEQYVEARLIGSEPFSGTNNRNVYICWATPSLLC